MQSDSKSSGEAKNSHINTPDKPNVINTLRAETLYTTPSNSDSSRKHSSIVKARNLNSNSPNSTSYQPQNNNSNGMNSLYRPPMARKLNLHSHNSENDLTSDRQPLSSETATQQVNTPNKLFATTRIDSNTLKKSLSTTREVTPPTQSSNTIVNDTDTSYDFSQHVSPRTNSEDNQNQQKTDQDRQVISQFLSIFTIGSGLALMCALSIALWVQGRSSSENVILDSQSADNALIWSESIEEMLEYQRKTKKLPPLPSIKNRHLIGLAPRGNYLPNKQLPGELVFSEKENAELVMTSQVDDPRLSEEIDLKKGFLRKVTQQVYSVVRKHPQKVDPVELTAMIVSESLKAELDPLLVASVIRTESAFDPKAISPVGAQGLMQIMPATKIFIENMEAIDPSNRKSIFSPRYNVKLGVAYIKYLRELYSGNTSLALMAYNWGPGHISKTLKNKKSTVPHSVLRYALKILDDHSAWHARISSTILFE
jgi:hypothetical protein